MRTCVPKAAIHAIWDMDTKLHATILWVVITYPCTRYPRLADTQALIYATLTRHIFLYLLSYITTVCVCPNYRLTWENIEYTGFQGCHFVEILNWSLTCHEYMQDHGRYFWWRLPVEIKATFIENTYDCYIGSWLRITSADQCNWQVSNHLQTMIGLHSHTWHYSGKLLSCKDLVPLWQISRYLGYG